MASITIVSGCPGTGKTTLAEWLANQAGQGMHLVADAFYEALAGLPQPGRPALSEHKAVTVATAQAAGVFAAGGRDVYVDGVVIPWFLPAFVRAVREVDAPVHYLVLRAGLEETLARSLGRDEPTPEDVLRRIHEAFADLGALERHVIDTSGQTADESLAWIKERCEEGSLRLDVESFPA